MFNLEASCIVVLLIIAAVVLPPPREEGKFTERSPKGAFYTASLGKIGAATGFLDLRGRKVDESNFVDVSYPKSFCLRPLRLLSLLMRAISVTITEP
jgi:hypothetical protein